MIRRNPLSRKPRQEGFWYSAAEPHLPKPVAQPTPWEGQQHFITCLRAIESAAVEYDESTQTLTRARYRAYRGFSMAAGSLITRDGRGLAVCYTM